MAENPGPFMSSAQFAIAVGVSKVAISKAINSGKISQALKQRGKRFLIHYRIGRWEYLGEGEPPTSEELDAIREPWPEEKSVGIGAKKLEKIGQSMPSGPGGDVPARTVTGGVYANARAMREQYAARIMKMKWEEMQGNLIPADVVRIERFKQGRLIRDALLNIPNRIGGALAAGLGISVDASKVAIIMEAELRAILYQVANANNSTTERNDTPGPPAGA